MPTVGTVFGVSILLCIAVFFVGVKQPKAGAPVDRTPVAAILTSLVLAVIAVVSAIILLIQLLGQSTSP